jgi:poly(3-hydroxyalkanoate) depolymerase
MDSRFRENDEENGQGSQMTKITAAEDSVQPGEFAVDEAAIPHEADALHGAEVMMMTAGGRTVRTARWKAARDTGRPPLLFFNGIGANIELVAPFARRMNRQDFVMFDMPGIGGSPEPLIPYTAVTMAKLAADLMADLGYDRMDVMGVSWGGAMAQHFAMQHPGRVRRAILCATSAGWFMVPGKISALSKMANPRRYIDPDFMAKNFATLYGGDLTGSMGHVGRVKPPTGTGYFYQLLAFLGWTSAPFLPFLMKAPTLVMMGGQDNIVPIANGRILASLIPGAELRIIDNGGHLFLVSHADETLAMIEEFLDRSDADVKAAA